MKGTSNKNKNKKFRLRVGDNVIVISGKDKGKKGQITKILSKSNKVIVSGINMKTKHKKVDPNTNEGGRLTIEAPMDISNVMYFCSSIDKPSKIGYKINDSGVKVRFCKKTGEEID